jgi:plastocyanin
MSSRGQKPISAAAIIIGFLFFAVVFYLIQVYPAERAELLAGEEGVVVIRDLSFSPAELHIRTGETVTWRNLNGVVHTVSGGTFDSGNIRPGSSFTHTFVAPGTYDYSCAIHPYMKGRVVVS